MIYLSLAPVQVIRQEIKLKLALECTMCGEHIDQQRTISNMQQIALFGVVKYGCCLKCFREVTKKEQTLGWKQKWTRRWKKMFGEDYKGTEVPDAFPTVDEIEFEEPPEGKPETNRYAHCGAGGCDSDCVAYDNKGELVWVCSYYLPDPEGEADLKPEQPQVVLPRPRSDCLDGGCIEENCVAYNDDGKVIFVCQNYIPEPRFDNETT